jgi:hypothetical protein
MTDSSVTFKSKDQQTAVGYLGHLIHLDKYRQNKQLGQGYAKEFIHDNWSKTQSDSSEFGCRLHIPASRKTIAMTLPRTFRSTIHPFGILVQPECGKLGSTQELGGWDFKTFLQFEDLADAKVQYRWTRPDGFGAITLHLALHLPLLLAWNINQSEKMMIATVTP